MALPRPFPTYYVACLSLGLCSLANGQNNELTQVQLAKPTAADQCAGQWQQLASQPVPSTLALANNQPTTIDADYAWFKADQQALLEGNVQINQGTQTVNAERVDYNIATGDISANSNIVLSTPQQRIQAEQITYNLNQGTGEIRQARFSDQATSANGQAESIKRVDPSISQMKNAVFSTCANTTSAWAVHSGLLQVNQQTGRGTSRNTVFTVKNTPVFYLPYFNFPIDDRRASGFLTPSIGLEGVDNVKLSTPFYVNLHPQVDLTLTPSLYLKRNPQINSELRYLLAPSHQGKLQGGFSASDDTYNNQDRKQLLWAHRSQFNSRVSGEVLWQYMSDKDYLADLASSPLSAGSVFLERHATLNYQREQLNALLKVQSYQILDFTLTDSEKPYSRAPQLQIEYTHSKLLGQQNLLFSNLSDIGYFNKPINDNSATDDSGLRFYQNLGVSLPIIKRQGGIIPALHLRALGYQLKNDTLINPGNTFVFAPLLNLDTFANFEKASKQGRQSIEPRAMVTYAPYKDQSTLPNYDTIELNYNYDRLFSPTRFIGHDRLDDQNTISLGLQYKAFDVADRQKFSLALGEQYYQSIPRVSTGTLQSIAEKRSGVAFSSNWGFAAGLALKLDHSWTPNWSNNYSYASILLKPQPGMAIVSNWVQSAEIGYLERQQTNNSDTNQVVRASLVSKRVKNWALLGYSQYDVLANRFRDQLVGIDYRSCCWRMGLYSRSVYADVRDIKNEKPNRQIYLELSLKGVAGLSSKVSNLLKNKIPEYEGMPP